MSVCVGGKCKGSNWQDAELDAVKETTVQLLVIFSLSRASTCARALSRSLSLSLYRSLSLSTALSLLCALFFTRSLSHPLSFFSALFLSRPLFPLALARSLALSLVLSLARTGARADPLSVYFRASLSHNFCLSIYLSLFLQCSLFLSFAFSLLFSLSPTHTHVPGERNREEERERVCGVYVMWVRSVCVI